MDSSSVCERLARKRNGSLNCVKSQILKSIFYSVYSHHVLTVSFIESSLSSESVSYTFTFKVFVRVFLLPSQMSPTLNGN